MIFSCSSGENKNTILLIVNAYFSPKVMRFSEANVNAGLDP
jgi:hypothetical protein